METDILLQRIVDEGIREAIEDPVLFSENVKLVLASFSKNTLKSLPEDFWEKEIPVIINLKKILECGDEETKTQMPLGPIEYLKSVIREEINNRALQILQN